MNTIFSFVINGVFRWSLFSSSSPPLSLSFSKNDVHNCSKNVQLSCNYKHFPPFFTICSNIPWSIRRLHDSCMIHQYKLSSIAMLCMYNAEMHSNIYRMCYSLCNKWTNNARNSSRHVWYSHQNTSKLGCYIHLISGRTSCN